MDAAIEVEHQRHGVLGDGVRRVRGDTGHADPESGRGFEVHVVVPGAAQCQMTDPDLGQLCEGGGVALVVDEQRDGGEPRGETGSPR